MSFNEQVLRVLRHLNLWLCYLLIYHFKIFKLNGTWTLALRIVSPESCQFATDSQSWVPGFKSHPSWKFNQTKDDFKNCFKFLYNHFGSYDILLNKKNSFKTWLLWVIYYKMKKRYKYCMNEKLINIGLGST